jgi:hypothetical protein
MMLFGTATIEYWILILINGGASKCASNQVTGKIAGIVVKALGTHVKSMVV